MTDGDEPAAVAARYARRGGTVADRYGALRPDVWQTLHERQRALLRRFAAEGIADVSALRLTEVGCGSGGNLLELLRLGFAPEHLTGIELLPERHAQSRRVLPAALTLWPGDALHAPVEAASQHVVLQSTVFSSLLDSAYQQRLADAMWSWLAPGGAVLWYDMRVDNPANRDVRGIPAARMAALFPHAARIAVDRVTLVPPLARAVCRVHPALYRVLNALPLLRTHLLAWVVKPARDSTMPAPATTPEKPAP